MGFFRKGEDNTQSAAIDDLKRKIEAAKMPAEVREIAEGELGAISRISPAMAEYSIGLTYIEYLASLPWDRKTEDHLDLGRAEMILSERHFGLGNVKERILEHLAVKKLLLSQSKLPHILVVDDEEVAVRNLEHVLQKEDYTVETALSGAEALRKMEISSFDLVLTDLRMQKMGGIELLERIRASYPQSRVIVITAFATIESATEAIKKGAFNYITKPFKLDEVRSAVKAAIEKASSLSIKGSVLCFSGPPGTGKTSLGQGIAEALGRNFSRISLGGVRDEAEIRGHRRTYAGAMPGRIIEEIRRAQSSNPVLMLDEIDKMHNESRVDTASALLEVLDPEQNHSFIDHYVDAPFDLSSVMFIVTANVADNIYEPLLDRLEVIEFPGYTEEDKEMIAERYLIPRQIRQQGLSHCPPEFTRDALASIIQSYTKEAGLRGLERQIATICRKIAKEIVLNACTAESRLVTPQIVETLLGPRRYYFEAATAKNRVGVTTGLVWTETGGDIIFVEAAKMWGSKELILTGSLGTVMRESAQAALSYIRSNAAVFNLPEDFFENHDIHIHVPAGAIPKDGPSAGATIAMALLSMLMARPARRGVAVSGELSLGGRILPVGGTREKILAASRAGVKEVILPLKNKVDIDDLPPNMKKDLEFFFAESIEEMVDRVLI
ncbi:MAG TPA: S16 family serine protease [Dissulfurispiraceae bacterium]|nr:S16 family serine protease [Dissulfurispiraceae bacterium]